MLLSIIKERIAETERVISKVEKQIDKAANQYSLEIALLQTIPGVAKDSAISIISDTGSDMSQFPREKHLSKWAGMRSGCNESAGKKSTRITHGNKHLRTTLVEYGWGTIRTKDSYLKNKYESLFGPIEKKKALIAVGHKIRVSAYFILKNKEPYK